MEFIRAHFLPSRIEMIERLTEGVNTTKCLRTGHSIVGAGPTGHGELWGNFTDGHFVLRDGQVVTNSRSHGKYHAADKWLMSLNIWV